MQGTFGLGVLLSILFLLAKKILSFTQRKSNLINFYLFASVLAYFVSMFFGFSLTIHYLLLYIFFAFLSSSITKQKKIIIKNTPVKMAFAGVLTVFLLLNIFNSLKVVYADIKYKQGVSHIYRADFYGGVKKIDYALSLNNNQEDIYFHLSDIVFLLAKESNSTELLVQAEELLEPIFDFSGGSFRYYFSKARINTYLEKYQLAEEYYKKASELAPINPIIMKEWGAMYYLSENYEEVVIKLERFLSLIPNYWERKIYLEDLSEQESEEYRLFIKHVPDLWIVFTYLSRSYAELGDISKAEFYYQYIEDEEQRDKVQKIINNKKGEE